MLLFFSSDEFCAPGEQSSALQGQCVSCFCAGRSQNCSRANVYRNRVSGAFSEVSERPLRSYSYSLITLVDIVNIVTY